MPEAAVELVKGARGAFTVLADGRAIWDKRARGRFPTEQEIIQALGG